MQPIVIHTGGGDFWFGLVVGLIVYWFFFDD